MKPIVIAHHLSWTVYGSWFANDLRGSMSREQRAPWLKELADAHFGRKRTQPTRAEFRAFLFEARKHLKHPWFEFRPAQFGLVADALSEIIIAQKYTCYALAIMPDHIHVLIRKHKHKSEEMIDRFQRDSRLRLSAALGLCADHPVWTRQGHHRFLSTPPEIHDVIEYINLNPEKLNLPLQRWPIVKPYDNWPLHPGHNPNSPYARRMR